MIRSVETVTVASSDWEMYDPETTLRTEDGICLTTEDGDYIAVDDSVCTWSATITPSGVTANSKIDLQMDADLVAAGIQDKILGFMTVNDNGTVKLLCTGMSYPSVSIDFKCIIYDVDAA